MNKRFFAFDKNYLLKEAQAKAEYDLLHEMMAIVRSSYEMMFNPLGLVDDTILAIRNTPFTRVEAFSGFYTRMAALYRYKFDDNQLALVFDGKSNEEKYREEWSCQFLDWIRDFCQDRVFLVTIIEEGLFYNDQNRSMSAERLITYLHEKFEVRFYPKKGITPWKPKPRMRVNR